MQCPDSLNAHLNFLSPQLASTGDDETRSPPSVSLSRGIAIASEKGEFA